MENIGSVNVNKFSFQILQPEQDSIKPAKKINFIYLSTKA